MPTIFAFTVIGLGLNIVTGFTGLLNLGAAAFVAIGAYAYSILTCDIYPFRLGFWSGLGSATIIGALVGTVLGLPTMRLRGDYLAIVTLGFGEIVQDLLKNLEPITKGTQGINPVPHPTLGAFAFTSETHLPFYYLYLAFAALAALLCRNLRRSRVGRGWVAVREDELAARACGVNAARAKLSAFAWGAALCSAGGALVAALVGTSIEPGYYDFQLSIVVLCAVIVGGMGSVPGVLLGSLLMFGFNSIVIVRLADALGGSASANVLASPNNWKFLVFGLALILAMRLKPEGLLPAREVRAELHRPAGAKA
jgi:branched-chain amino acid transport system permease protein